jgi:hypothetical protein
MKSLRKSEIPHMVWDVLFFKYIFLYWSICIEEPHLVLTLRATAWENWHIFGKSNSYYFLLLSWNSHQIFFSLYKKYKLNIFGLQNWAPPSLQSSKSAVLQFSWKHTFYWFYFIIASELQHVKKWKHFIQRLLYNKNLKFFERYYPAILNFQEKVLFIYLSVTDKGAFARKLQNCWFWTLQKKEETNFVGQKYLISIFYIG